MRSGGGGFTSWPASGSRSLNGPCRGSRAGCQPVAQESHRQTSCSALGEYRRHQFPQRPRKVTFTDLGNAPAGADLIDRLPRLRPVRRRDLQVSRGRQPLPPVTVNTPGGIHHPGGTVPPAPIAVTTISTRAVCPAPGTLKPRDSPSATRQRA